MVARGADIKTAPKDPRIFHTLVFPLGDGSVFRGISLPKGTDLKTLKTVDTIVYVLKGHLTLQLGKETSDVGPGDSWRKIASQENHYLARDDVTILETDVPKQEVHG